MTREELKKELLEKLRPGVKASEIKKLKRSKSADDINNNPPPNLLQDQLNEKQKLIEELRKQLEKVNDELKETKQELDNSLSAQVAGIKTFGKEHDKRVKAQQELNETIDEASDELKAGDDKVSDLRTKLRTAQQTIQQLNNELKWERIKKGTNLNTSPELPESINYLKYALYSLLAVWFTLTLINHSQVKNHA